MRCGRDRDALLCCTLGREASSTSATATDRAGSPRRHRPRARRTDRCSAVDHDVAGGEELRPASSSPRPSRLTSPAIVWRRRAISPSNRSPSSPRSRSKQSLRRISRSLFARPERCAARGGRAPRPRIRDASKQALDERGSEEACRPGHGDPPGGELVEYHECVSSTRLWRSTLTIQVVCRCQLFGGSERAGRASSARAGSASVGCSACWAWAPSVTRAPWRSARSS